MKITPLLAAALAGHVLTGCVGLNHTLFMTKSNVGLDLDTKPPTLEVSIARREGVIAPTFEGGQTPPVLASFALEPGSNVPVFPRISQTFAGGDASVTMSALYGSPNTPEYDPAAYDSTLWLQAEPKPRIWGKAIKMPRPGTVHPFVFGTDTSFGLKAAWSGLTAQFPDTVKLGLNRKEFALAPVFLSQSKTNEGGLFNAVKMPSFLATMDNSTELSSPQKSGVRHVQYFATGLAAERMALHPEVRQAMIQRLDPKGPDKARAFRAAAKQVQIEQDKVDRIVAFVTVDGKVSKAKLESLTKGTGLEGNQDWLDAYAGKDAGELKRDLLGDYYQYVSPLAQNLPK